MIFAFTTFLMGFLAAAYLQPKHPSVHDNYRGKMKAEWQPLSKEENWLKDDGYCLVDHTDGSRTFAKPCGIYPYYGGFDLTIHYHTVHRNLVSYGDEDEGDSPDFTPYESYTLQTTSFRGMSSHDCGEKDGLSEADMEKINADFNSSAKSLFECKINSIAEEAQDA